MLRTGLVVFIKLMVFHYHERRRFLQEFLTGRGQFQQTIILNIFLEIASQYGLPDNRVPQFPFILFSCTEKLMILMLVRKDFLRLPTNDKIYYMV